MFRNSLLGWSQRVRMTNTKPPSIYRLLVLSRDHHGKLCCMPSWSQWSCGKGYAGALNVLQSWLWKYVQLYTVLLRSLHDLACVAGQAYGPACSPGIAWGFPSLVIVSLVIRSTPLATYSVPRSSDIERLVLSLFVPPLYLSVQRGCHTFQATCLFSLLLLPPLQYRRTVLTFSGGPLVCSMEQSVSSCHRSYMPTSSAIHPCPWSGYYINHRW